MIIESMIVVFVVASVAVGGVFIVKSALLLHDMRGTSRYLRALDEKDTWAGRLLATHHAYDRGEATLADLEAARAEVDEAWERVRAARAGLS